MIFDAEHHIPLPTQLGAEKAVELLVTHHQTDTVYIDDNRIGSLNVGRTVYIHSVCRRIVVSVMDIPDFQHVHRECVDVVQTLRDLFKFQPVLLEHFVQESALCNASKGTESSLSLDTYRLADSIL